MEPIAQLRSICQTTAKKDVSNVYMRYVSRFFSIYLTRALLPLGVTADQASFLMIAIGILSGFFLARPDWPYFLGGALLLQFWYVLDCSDGEIARYHFYKMKDEIAREKTQLAMTGGYWDYLNHYLVHGLVPFCVAYGLYERTADISWISWGFAASLAQTMLLAVHDTKSRAFVEKIKKGAVAGHAVQAKTAGNAAPQSAGKRWGPAKWAFVAMHYSCTYPTVMNVLLLTALWEWMTGNTLMARGAFLVYYALASWAVFLGLAAKNLRDKGVDRQFDEIFMFKNL